MTAQTWVIIFKPRVKLKEHVSEYKDLPQHTTFVNNVTIFLNPESKLGNISVNTYTTAQTCVTNVTIFLNPESNSRNISVNT